MTSMLIESYSTLKESKSTQGDKFWKKISAALKEKGCDIDFKKCETKWKTLIRTYKRNLDKKNKLDQAQFIGFISTVCTKSCMTGRK